MPVEWVLCIEIPGVPSLSPTTTWLIEYLEYQKEGVPGNRPTKRGTWVGFASVFGLESNAELLASGTLGIGNSCVHSGIMINSY